MAAILAALKMPLRTRYMNRGNTMGIGLVLILIAFVLALLEAFHLLPNPRVSWGWLAIAFFLAYLLIGGARLSI